MDSNESPSDLLIIIRNLSRIPSVKQKDRTVMGNDIKRSRIKDK